MIYLTHEELERLRRWSEEAREGLRRLFQAEVREENESKD